MGTGSDSVRDGLLLGLRASLVRFCGAAPKGLRLSCGRRTRQCPGIEASKTTSLRPRLCLL